FFFFSSRRRHTRCLSDWSSDVCSSDLVPEAHGASTSRYRKLLIERAIPARLRPGDIARQSGESPTVHLRRADHWIVNVAVNYPEIGRASCRERVSITGVDVRG